METKLDSDVKGRIIGVQTQMSQYKLLFGLHLCKKILLINDNLSKTLQKQTLSAAKGQEIASLTITTLRSSGAFNLFFELVERFCDKNGVSKPSLPRKRKAPRHVEVGTGSGYFSTSVQEHYCQIYYEVIDFVIAGISGRFDQPGYTLYKMQKIFLLRLSTMLLTINALKKSHRFTNMIWILLSCPHN